MHAVPSRQPCVPIVNPRRDVEQTPEVSAAASDPAVLAAIGLSSRAAFLVVYVEVVAPDPALLVALANEY